ncbi:MAG: hypothetical protein K9N10_15790 [Deltaproteobacteria bacterium]|nr:hypothetical protein [Deltaproteobacteria bacterium]
MANVRIGKVQFNGAGGFALIEILVAVSVLAISLVVILQLFSGGLKSRQLSEQYARGVIHAREKMAEMLIDPGLSEGDTQGEFKDGYQWQAIITRLASNEEEKLPVNLLNVELRITWRDGEKAKTYSIDTLRLAAKEKTS